MKKVFVFVAAAIFVYGLAACKKESPAVSSDVAIEPRPVAEGVMEDRVFEPGNFFTPDYTPYEPEPESAPGKLQLSAPKAKGGKIAGVIPGLRKLTEYLTKYSTKRTDFSFPAVTAADGDASSAKKSSRNVNEPFTVSDWGPQDAIPAEVRFPSFYVLFSEPVVALSALGTQSDKSDVFSVEPAVKGVFRWNGTSLLSFDCTEPVNPLQEYRIVVSEKLKSLGGKVISGKTAFSTKAAPLAVIWSAAGYSKS